jgi:hypothetical protein
LEGVMTKMVDQMEGVMTAMDQMEVLMEKMEFLER